MKTNATQNYTKLSPKQLQAISLLTAIPNTYTSLDEVSKKVGVCRKTLYNWFEEDDFNETLQKETDNNFRKYSAAVRSAHLKGILEDRNPRLIQLYYERVEGWIPRQTETSDEDKVIVNFMGTPSPFIEGANKYETPGY